MRIDHVVPHFHPDVGGVESSVLGLSEFLVSKGHDVVVHTSHLSYSGSRLPESDTVRGVSVRRYPPRFRLGYYATLFTPEFAGADIVHLHGYGHLTNDWSARKVHGTIPSVFSLHHGVAQPAPDIASGIKRRVYDPMIGLRTLRLVRLVVAASEPDRRWLEARGHAAFPVRVIPTGLEDSAYERGDPKRAHQLAGLHRYFLFLGRLHREKSVDHLLRAFARLEDREVGVVLAGPDAGAKDDLLGVARRIGIEDRVATIGRVDEGAKRDLLAGADALVLPSFYEAQGIVILESWAQGRPVVASAVGGVPSLVSDGKDGLLYRYGDVGALAARLRQILDDPASATQIGLSGRDKAATYAFRNLAPRFLDAYDWARAAAG